MILQILYNRLNSGHARTILVKKNIVALFAIKGISMLNSLLLVPLCIAYLNPQNYGVWLTIFSMLSWFGLLDIGLGNGLRNKFAECKAAGNTAQIKTYISTAYFLLGLIMLATVLLFLFINRFLNWQQIFNTRSIDELTLHKTMIAVFIFFCAQMTVKLISSVLIADQKTFMSALINCLSSILTLASVYVLSKTTSSSIYYMGVLTGAVNVLAPLAIGVYYFSTEYRAYAPSLKSVNFKESRGLIRTGLVFFLFQSTALIVVATDNIIISQLFGPEEVTPYNIAIKYFAPLTVFFGILSAPLWSAYTEAYQLKDFEWIRSITRKMVRIWMLLVLVFVPFVLLSPFIYRIWLGEEMEVSLWLTFWVGVYVLISSFNQIFTNFINGVGKIRLGFYLTLFTGLVNIPLCFLMADYFKLGTAGIIMASSVSLLPDIIFLPMQYKKIVEQKAEGVWNR